MVNVLLFSDNYFEIYFMRAVGTYRIATEIRKAGYTCQVVDFFGFMTHDDIQKIIDKYVGKETLVVGFGSTLFMPSPVDDYLNNSPLEQMMKNRKDIMGKMTYEEMCGVKYPYPINIIKETIIEPCKKKNPNIKFVYGGTEAKYKPSEGIDCVFTNNNNDLDIIDYLNKLTNNQPLVNEYNLTNGIPFNFNFSQNIWDESDHIFEKEMLPLEVSRGCIFNCKFCSFTLRGKSKFDYVKDPEVLKEELLRNYELFGTTSYILCDETFNDTTKKLDLILNNVTSKLPFKLELSAFLRLDLINADWNQADLLKEIGLKWCFFGIESLSEKALKLIGKTLYKEKMQDVMLQLKEKWGDDVLTTGSFIYGLPGETKESLKEYERWLVEDSLNYFDYISFWPLRLSLNEYINPQLKSEIAINFDKYGLKKNTENERYKNFNWESKELGITYVDANNVVNRLTSIIRNDPRCKWGGSDNIGIYNADLTFDQVKNRSYSDILNDQSIKNTYLRKIKEYKQKLIYG